MDIKTLRHSADSDHNLMQFFALLYRVSMRKTKKEIDSVSEQKSEGIQQTEAGCSQD